MSHKKFGDSKLLVITPTLSGGSWLTTEKILSEFVNQNYKVVVIGLSRVIHRNRFLSYVSIPFWHYDLWGPTASKSPIIAFFFFTPLFIIGLFSILFNDAKTVIINGCSTAIILAPIVKLRGKKLILTYHTSMYDQGIIAQKLLKPLGYMVDIAIVNSKGSFVDAQSIIPNNKLIINSLWADDIFFSGLTETLPTKTNHTLKILYIGRIDPDKLCVPLIKIAQKFGNDLNFSFTFAGTGNLSKKISTLAKKYNNIFYLGYINDREKLKKLYYNADILWSYADETYLGIPALEALACGTPIMIPNQPAIVKKIKKGDAGIDHFLVPSNIGWIVDIKNIDSIVNLLQNIQNTGISATMRKQCREYAKKNYSSKKILNTVAIIKKIIHQYV